MLNDLIDRLDPIVTWVIARLECVPYWLLALPLRAAVANIFWSSGMVKIADWNATLFLFSTDYRLPLLPPAIAAPLATTIELSTPILLVLGLGTRFAALVLFGMTMTIQLLVEPGGWRDHIIWVAMILVLICRGAGMLSLDHLIARFVRARRPASV